MAVVNLGRDTDDPSTRWMESVFYKRLGRMELESAEFFFFNFLTSSRMKIFDICIMYHKSVLIINVMKLS